MGVRLEPLGPVSFAEARELFSEQVTALVEAGVDLLIFETFRDLDELREAVLAAREAAGREIPLIAQFAIEDDGNLEDGTSAANIALALSQWPVDVIGLNCSSGPRVLLEAIETMAPLTTQATQRDAQCRSAGDGGGAQFIFVLARIYGAIRAALYRSRGEDCGRLLRDYAGAHQRNP